jgi:hypothetical protein
MFRKILISFLSIAKIGATTLIAEISNFKDFVPENKLAS